MEECDFDGYYEGKSPQFQAILHELVLVEGVWMTCIRIIDKDTESE